MKKPDKIRKPLKPIYYGFASTGFWQRINALPEPTRSRLYNLGCELQNREFEIIEAIHRAESILRANAKKRKARDGK